MQDPGEGGGLQDREPARGLAEIGLRGGLDAIGTVAEVHGVEVLLQDRVLAQLLLELDRKERLTNLLGDGPLGRDVDAEPGVRIDLVGARVYVLDQLLRDRGRTLGRLPLDEVGVGGAQDPRDVDAWMAVEAVVLGRDHRVDDVRRHLRQGDHRSIHRPVQRRDLVPVPVVKVRGPDRRVSGRQLDPGVRDEERTHPQQEHDEGREQQEQPPAAPDEGLLLRGLLRRLGGSMSWDVVVPARAGSGAGCHGRTMLATRWLRGGSACAGCVTLRRGSSRLSRSPCAGR